MTTPATIDIDEIIAEIVNITIIANLIEGPKTREKAFNKVEAQAREALTALITEKENRARVDELERFGLHAAVTMSQIKYRSNRVAELEATLKSKGKTE